MTVDRRRFLDQIRRRTRRAAYLRKWVVLGALRVPRGEVVLREGDRLSLFAAPSSMDAARSLLADHGATSATDA